MNKIKVKIIKKPNMEFGGQINFGLDLRNTWTNSDSDSDNLNTTLSPVDKRLATLEAEKGEFVVGNFRGDGILSTMKVGGKKHSEGGTPLNLPDNSFIFSDSKRLALKSKDASYFGKSASKNKKYTPAELAKQYDVNKYQAILDDPDADQLSKRTASLMIQNYMKKLGELALVQEAKKGFENGIPDISLPVVFPVEPSQFIQQGSGNAKNYFEEGGSTDIIDPYSGNKDGKKTPTKKSNKYVRGKEYLEKWEKLIPGISKMSNEKAQAAIYDYTLKNNPDAIRNMWKEYGLTRKGLTDKSLSGKSYVRNEGVFTDDDLADIDELKTLKTAYVDGYFGVRQLDPEDVISSSNSSLKYFKDDPRAQRRAELDALGRTAALPTGYGNITEPNLESQISSIKDVKLPKPTDVSSDTRMNVNNVSNADKNFHYMYPDQLSLAQAVINRGNIKKYTPWEAPVEAVTPIPTFYDPSRELAANAEMMNTQMMYNSVYGDPQSTAARNSYVAGKAAENAANIMSRYNQLNVGTANQFSAQAADIMNRLQAAKAQRANNLYQGNVIANQQYDNAVRQADNEILKARINAWNNRSQLHAVNSMNPYYTINPRSGAVEFNSPEAKENFFKTLPGYTGMTSTTSSGYENSKQNWTYDQWVYKYTNDYKLPLEEARKLASKQIENSTLSSRTTSIDKNNDGIYDSRRVTQRGIIPPFEY